MSTPNPLMPQGAIAQPKGKSNVKIAVFTILAIHAVLLVGLLVQGCNKKPTASVADNSTSTNDTAAVSGSTGSADANANLGTPAGPGSTAFVPPANAAAATPQAPVSAPNTVGTANPPTLTPVTTPTVVTPIAPVVDPGATANVPSVSGKEYVVARGDSLGKIAKKNGVSVKALQDANPNVVPTKLQIGQKLQIPAAAASTASATPATPATGATADVAAPASNDGVYVVKSGDVLERIAKSHGTSVKAIKTANNLHTDHLKVGQKLKMPASKSTATADAAPATPASPLATSTITPTATMAAATK